MVQVMMARLVVTKAALTEEAREAVVQAMRAILAEKRVPVPVVKATEGGDADGGDSGGGGEGGGGDGSGGGGGGDLGPRIAAWARSGRPSAPQPHILHSYHIKVAVVTLSVPARNDIVKKVIFGMTEATLAFSEATHESSRATYTCADHRLIRSG